MLKLLGVDAQFLKDTMKMQKRHRKQQAQGKSIRGESPRVTDAYSNGYVKGTIGEAFEAVFGEAVADELQGRVASDDMAMEWDTEWTGGSGVKPDVVLYNLTWTSQIDNIDLLKSQEGEDSSKRTNAINKYRQWFQLMKEAEGEIIFISDKNYQIDSKFGGFTAQDRVTLANLLSLLNTVGANATSELIDFLANCGGDMLLGARQDEVLDAVATQIGHFLFDDLTIKNADTNINRIHLLNLSGVYLPLSVYLEGIHHAVQEVQTDVKGFVSVSFVSKPGAGAAASPWTGDWEEFRDARIHQSYVNVHFMANFASFITSKVKL